MCRLMSAITKGGFRRCPRHVCLYPKSGAKADIPRTSHSGQFETPALPQSPDIFLWSGLSTWGAGAPRAIGKLSAVLSLPPSLATWQLSGPHRSRPAHTQGHIVRRVTGKDVLIHLALIGASFDGRPTGEFTYLVGLIRAGLTHAARRLFCLV